MPNPVPSDQPGSAPPSGGEWPAGPHPLDRVLLQHILEDSLNEIFVFDEATLEFIQVNQGARRNLGFSMDELRTMTPLSIKPAFTDDQFATLVQPLRTGEREKVVFHTHHRRKDGSDYPVEVHLQLARSGPRPVFVAIILDITDRVLLEDQFFHAQKMETVGRLTGSLAHDLNNLLAGVMTGCRLTRRKMEGGRMDEARILSTEIEEHVRRGTELTRSLLDYSRSGTTQTQTLDPDEILRTTSSVLQYLIGEDVALEVAILGHRRFVANAGRIEQVIMNLCLNARDAMPRGGRIWLHASDVDVFTSEGRTGPGRPEPGGYVAICVTDTGSGMSPDVQSKAFEPYYTTKEVGKGTGLGLSTVSQIVRDAGGFIELDSQRGRGTSLRLYFPHREAPADAPGLARETPVLGGSGETILVVEDEALLRAAMKELLEELGYRPLTAANPGAALELAESLEDPVDLVMTDVVMPGMGGPEMVDRIRERVPDVRVLYMSGFSRVSLVQEGRMLEGVPFLAKPFDEEGLAVSVRSTLDGHSGD